MYIDFYEENERKIAIALGMFFKERTTRRFIEVFDGMFFDKKIQSTFKKNPLKFDTYTPIDMILLMLAFRMIRDYKLDYNVDRYRMLTLLMTFVAENDIDLHAVCKHVDEVCSPLLADGRIIETATRKGVI